MTKHYFELETGEHYREIDHKIILGEGDHSTEEVELANTIGKRLERMRVGGDVVYCKESAKVIRDCIRRIRKNFSKNKTATNHANDLEDTLDNSPAVMGHLSGLSLQTFIGNLKASEYFLFPSDNKNLSAFDAAIEFLKFKDAEPFLAKDSDGNYRYPDIIANIAADYNSALTSALRAEQRKVVERLLFKDENGKYEFPDIIANIGVIYLPHLYMRKDPKILDRLLSKDESGEYEFPDLIPNTSKEFREATSLGSSEFIKRLLVLPGIFANAEGKIGRFPSSDHYLVDFVNSYVSDLVFRQEDFEKEYPGVKFDLEEDDARFCFFIVRNLIRRDESLEKINQLLAIPAVSQKGHKFKNELLKIAMRNNNEPVVERLLQLPKVRERAKKKKYYSKESCKLDIKRLAEKAESLMLASKTGFYSTKDTGAQQQEDASVQEHPGSPGASKG